MSIRGNVGKGIGNFEFGYYDSADDENGDNRMVENSQLRFLVGYTQELGKDFTGGVQYYVERMLDYGAYVDNLTSGPVRDKYREWLTFRLTKLAMNQNLKLSLFTYFSPSDKDVYMRPNLNYKVSDELAFEVGANVFFGVKSHTFFGQLKNNTNLYTAIRYSF